MFIDLPVGLKVSFNKQTGVKFYRDLSLEISIDLPVLRSILVNRVKSYPDLSLEISMDLPTAVNVNFNKSERSVSGNFHRITRVLKSNVINRVQFYGDLSLEISIDLPVIRNIIVSE